MDGQGLNITVHGYRGGLHFGLIACRELVPDVDALTGYIVDELGELQAAAAAAAESPAGDSAEGSAEGSAGSSA